MCDTTQVVARKSIQRPPFEMTIPRLMVSCAILSHHLAEVVRNERAIKVHGIVKEITHYGVEPNLTEGTRHDIYSLLLDISISLDLYNFIFYKYIV